MAPDDARVVLCADWSKDTGGRSLYVAEVARRRVARAERRAAWTVAGALSAAERYAGQGPVVLAFDAPLGVPRSYWDRVRAEAAWAGCRSFAGWVRIAPGASSLWADPATRPEDWAVDRPFFRMSPGAGSRRRWERALQDRGVDLLRTVDRLTGAKPVFVTSGIPGSVGSAARDIWQGLADAHRGGRRFSIWPFEEAQAPEGVLVAEIYPRAAYAVALSGEPPATRTPTPLAKTKPAVRREALEGLLAADWVRVHGVAVADVEAALGSEDDFDALIAAAALLRCLLEGTPLSDPALEDPVAEGGILGTGSVKLDGRGRASRTSPGRGHAYAPGFGEGANMAASVSEMAASVRAATERELRLTPEDGRKRELVDGRIVVSPAGARHGQVAVRLVVRLARHVEAQGLGHVFDSSTAFRLPGGNVRVPDVSFVARGRFADGAVPEDFGDLTPDLVVEILSPHEETRPLLDKIGEYLQSGARLVWVIDPKRGRAAVYRSPTDVQDVAPDGVLEGEDVVPGFRCSVREILA
jgi:Uma2 family endonuclease